MNIIEPGSAARVHLWWAGLIADGGQLPPELVHKLRVIEGALPILGRVVGLRGVRSIADLIPATDAELEPILLMVNAWTAGILTGAAAAQDDASLAEQDDASSVDDGDASSGPDAPGPS